MSAPQLLQANPGVGATAYVNQIYPVDAVSKLVQIPDTKRIAKIVGTPVVGQVLLFSATGAGTVEDPDTLAFTSVGTDLALEAAGRTITSAYNITAPAGQQLTFDELLFDSSLGAFGNFDSYFVLPVVDVVYQGSVWAQVQVPVTAVSFDIRLTLGMFDPITAQTTIIGSNQSRVSAPTAIQQYRVGASGMCFPTHAASTLIAVLDIINASGALPAMTVQLGGFQVSSGSL